MLDLLERTVAGRIRPEIALVRVPIFGSFYTTRQPMRDFVDRTLARQGQDGILSVSLILASRGRTSPRRARPSLSCLTDDAGTRSNLRSTLRASSSRFASRSW